MTEDYMVVDTFVVGGIYQYSDRFGKYRHVEIVQKKGNFIEYIDDLGVKHKSKLLMDEYDEFIEEFFYIGRTYVKVHSWDCIGVSF